jgi:DNA-binding response OmpR family regulator
MGDTTSHEPMADNRSDGLGLRVLLVEDDTMLSMMLEDALSILGCTVIKAARVANGLELATTIEADIAVLDVNIAGEHVYPVARVLRRRGIPFVFVTAYVREGIPEEFHREPLLHKPFHLSELEDVLRHAARPAKAGSLSPR